MYSLSIVGVSPEDQYVSYINGTAIFTCTSLTAEILCGVRWLVNGTSLNVNNNVNISFNDGDGTGTLNFTNLQEEFNMTKIMCIGEFQSGREENSTNTVLVLIQGE